MINAKHRRMFLILLLAVLVGFTLVACGTGQPAAPQPPAPEAPLEPEPPQDPAPEDPTPVDPAPEDPVPEDPAPEDPAPEDPAPDDPDVRGPAEDTMRVLYLYGSIPPALHDMRLSDTGPEGMSQFAAALREVGFEPEERRDATVTLDAATLRDYRVLILGSNNRRFGEAEAAALAEWVEAGGGVVAWSDSAFGGHWRQVGVGNPVGKNSNNDLTLQFGLEFLRDNGAGIFTIRQYLDDHYLNDDNRNEGVVFRGEGVSLIRASAPARVLARLQTGGTPGEVRLHPDDGALTERDGALVVAEIGVGRVVGTFDRNGFWNGGEGTDITEVDNREHAQRIVLWAAGLGD